MKRRQGKDAVADELPFEAPSPYFPESQGVNALMRVRFQQLDISGEDPSKDPIVRWLADMHGLEVKRSSEHAGEFMPEESKTVIADREFYGRIREQGYEPDETGRYVKTKPSTFDMGGVHHNTRGVIANAKFKSEGPLVNAKEVFNPPRFPRP